MPCQVSVQSVVANSWPLAQGSGVLCCVLVSTLASCAEDSTVRKQTAIRTNHGASRRIQTSNSIFRFNEVGSVHDIRFICTNLYTKMNFNADCIAPRRRRRILTGPRVDCRISFSDAEERQISHELRGTPSPSRRGPTAGAQFS